jgi:hypothetical protein
VIKRSVSIRIPVCPLSISVNLAHWKTLLIPIPDTDSQTDVLRAAGIGIAENDPTEPILTLRMWVIGIFFCIIVCGLNTLYTLRTPSLTISGSVVLLLAYPLGKLWEKIVPDWTVPLGSWSFGLNPGPFNTKVCSYLLGEYKYRSNSYRNTL